MKLRFDNLLVPRGNGLGWTLNQDNPLATPIGIFISLIIGLCLYPALKKGMFLVKAYIDRRSSNT